jgi:hypothetical protein
MPHIYILHAKNIQSNHIFIELFSSENLLNQFLSNHPNVYKLEITLHEINPI